MGLNHMDLCNVVVRLIFDMRGRVTLLQSRFKRQAAVNLAAADCVVTAGSK
jgi:hypothetical protein